MKSLLKKKAIPFIATKVTFWPVKWVIPGTSTAIVAFGLVWFVQRAF